ncbi:MAG TPA: discoidin domain-containing protein [Polyangiaceae bacterium]
MRIFIDGPSAVGCWFMLVTTACSSPKRSDDEVSASGRASTVTSTSGHGGASSGTSLAIGGRGPSESGGATALGTASVRGGAPSSSASSLGGESGTPNGGSRPTSGNTAVNAGGKSANSGGQTSNATNAGASGGSTQFSSNRGGSSLGEAGARAYGGSVTLGGTGGGGKASTGGTAPSSAVAGRSGDDVIATIHNGVFWNDTKGNRIEAHGGGFINVSGTWYWIGEDKSQNSGNFKAVNCYASKDLQNWEFRRAIITKSTASALNTADRIIERPKVIYNDSTKQFVMWLHWEGQNYAEAAAGVFKSSTIDGDYSYVASFRPKNNMSRDDTLFKDDDGKAYFLSAANENMDLILYQLTDDYLDIGRQVQTLWAGSQREAPAILKVDTRYFIMNSAATGWDSNQAKYATATSITGSWSSLSNIGSSTTFDTQPTYVLPIKGTKQTTYVYAGDRWQDPDLKGSKYIWLPLTINGTSMTMDYYETWKLNLTTGEWWVDDGFLPQTSWKLLKVDSQETSGEDGKAANAFDNSASTIWHTQYTGDTPPHPHEIQIDLGAVYDLTGMRYLPRQDKDDHGMVAGYQFYVSDDSSQWGTAVASGTFNSDRTAKVVSFAKKSGRYVRFVALSEINGGDWTSVAELDLAGTAL